MYIHDLLNFRSQRDLDINTKNVKSLFGISSRLEFRSVNHTSIYEIYESKAFKNIKLLGETSNNWPNAQRNIFFNLRLKYTIISKWSFLNDHIKMTVYFIKNDDLILFRFNMKKLNMFNFLHIKLACVFNIKLVFYGLILL